MDNRMENLQYGVRSTMWVLGKDVQTLPGVTRTEVYTVSHVPRHERSTYSVTLPAEKRRQHCRIVMGWEFGHGSSRQQDTVAQRHWQNWRMSACVEWLWPAAHGSICSPFCGRREIDKWRDEQAFREPRHQLVVNYSRSNHSQLNCDPLSRTTLAIAHSKPTSHVTLRAYSL